MRKRRALVIGGSVGGLFAGNLLLRAGWDVEVFERVSGELESRGTGIVTHPDLLAILAESGAAVDETIGVRVEERVTLDRSGNRAAVLPMPQILTAWSRLYHALKQAFPETRYRRGRQLVAVAQDAREVVATFADGSVASGDLLVGADGLRSAVRRALLPEAVPLYAGYVAWRGLVEETALSERALRELFPVFAFSLPQREQMLGYPVAGRDNDVRPGRRRFNFVWYRPADEATTLRDLLTDGSGRIWDDGIPPPLIRPEVLAAARRDATAVLAPQFAEVVDKTETLFFQPIFDMESREIAFGRIALLGDAAFVARPHCGMGVAKAAGDAAALTSLLARGGDEAAALQVYGRARGAFGRRVVTHARGLGAYMQAQLRTPEERALAERGRSPQSVMAETGVPMPADREDERLPL